MIILEQDKTMEEVKDELRLRCVCIRPLANSKYRQINSIIYHNTVQLISFILQHKLSIFFSLSIPFSHSLFPYLTTLNSSLKDWNQVEIKG